jgi:hypothetical protein
LDDVRVVSERSILVPYYAYVYNGKDEPINFHMALSPASRAMQCLWLTLCAVGISFLSL